MAEMERIASFSIDHINLMSGLYVSRVDWHEGVAVTTFDLRFTMPNREPAMDIRACHTIEHLGATYLRNCARKDEIVYVGPMGCRTGCYIAMWGELKSEDVYDLFVEMCDFIINFEGEIPGTKPEECGNYNEHSLFLAKYYTKEYRKRLTENKCFTYPQL